MAIFGWKEATMATPLGTQRTVLFDRTTFSWAAVLAGVAAALVVQVLLTMLGLGIGLINLDTSSAAATPVGVSWGAFAYWAIAGIIAAFIGGWVAGAMTAPGTGAAHGLAAWAVTTLIVVGAATLAAGTTASIAGQLVGPTATSVARLNDLTSDTEGGATQRGAARQQELETARKAVASGMLASFIALLIGAAAAFAGGRMGSPTHVVDDVERRPVR
jgi:hypothetical protein